MVKMYCVVIELSVVIVCGVCFVLECECVQYWR